MKQVLGLALFRGRSACMLLLASILTLLSLLMTVDVAAQTTEQVCTTLEMSDEDCALVSRVSNMGNREWLVSSFDPLNSESGANLRSPTNPPDDTRLCLVLDVNLPVRTRIEFHWRAETEVHNDYFDFYINDRRSARESGGVSWRQVSVTAIEAVTQLSWCYDRDGTGDDSHYGRFDRLRFMATDFKQLVCDTLGMSSEDCALISTVAERGGTWFSSSFQVLPSAGANLRSPLGVADDAMACLDLTVDLPADSRINFQWRIETEENSDYFAFYLNDSLFARNSGLIDWRLLSITSPAAITQLSWCYERDASGGDPNADHGRLDGLQFNVSSNPWAQFCDKLRLSDGDCAQVISVRNAADHPWGPVTGAATFSGQGYQSDPGLSHNQVSLLSVTLAAGVVGLEFYRRVSSERRWDWLIFEYDDAERGAVSTGRALGSLTPYQSLPFFDGSGSVQGDLSGHGGDYEFGDGTSANYTVNLGSNRRWSLLRLLPTDGDITDLRWIYRKDVSASHFDDRGWIDSLQLHPALTDNTQLCEALDLAGASCSSVESFAEQPPARLWTVDDGITPAPTGGSALRVPLRVLDSEKACLSLSRPVAANNTVAFSWRLDAGANSMLTFEVGDTVQLTLTGTGSDSLWTTASWTATEAIDSFSLCYQGAEVTRAWVDALSISLSTQGFCHALRLSAADCALVISVRNTADHPWVPVTGDETFSGRGLQSDPNIGHQMESVLTATLAAGVVGLEFHRRVSSNINWDWLIFEYDNADRGSEFNGLGVFSSEPYQSLPFFDHTGTRVQGDLSGIKGSSLGLHYGNFESATSDINLGPNGEWSQLRLLPTDGDITELRWIYRGNFHSREGQNRGWIDSLRLHQGLTDSTELCEALDLETGQCNAVRSFVQRPSTRLWTVDDNVTPAPMGGSALGVPLRVPNGEKACLSLSRPVTAGLTVMFSWRLNAASNSALTFEVDGTVELTLTGDGSDSGWTMASWDVTAAVDSFAWCYQGAEVTQAWVDALRILQNLKQPFCDTLRLSEADCALVQSVETSNASPWEPVTGAETFSGQGYQSAPGLPHSAESVLTATLAPGVVGLEFYRRVSSETGWDWLTFEYNDIERGYITRAVGLRSSQSYQSLPFFDGSGSRVQGDLSGVRGFYTYGTFGTFRSANSDINSGANGEWSLLRLLPTDGDITELRWIYRKDGSTDRGLDRGWIDSLQLYPAVTTTTQLCGALDLQTGQCNTVRSYAQQPAARLWTVDEGITPAPTGGSALRVPLRVPNGEKACLSLSRPVSASYTVVFSWRLNAASNSMLTFEVGDTVQLTLTGTGSDSLWTTASWTATEAIDSLSWCYQGAEVTRAWVDALSISLSTPGFCHALRLSAADCARVISVENTDHPWEPVVGTETFSGRGLQSDPGLADNEESLLSVTLASGVVGLEFYRRVSSEANFDWLIFEYDDTERGEVVSPVGRLSSPPYRTLPFFDGANTRGQGDLSGTRGIDYAYGNMQSANADINLGPNGEWSLLRLLPTDGDITELRWIYRKDGSTDEGQDRGWIDSLRLYPALTDDNLCEALDTIQCNAVESFAEQPPTRLWTVDDGITPAPRGGSALRAPLRVTNDEKTCLSLSLPIPAGLTVMFSWRLNAASNSTLTFEVNNTVELTLAGNGSDSGWNSTSWTATATIDSFSWCYQGAEVTQAWVDALRILVNRQPFCSALSLSEVDCALVESVETSLDHPWEIATGAETLSGNAYQSDPGLNVNEESVLAVTLAPGVVGLEFYRRVNSDMVSSAANSDFLIFEYNGIERNSESYRSLPFFDIAGTPIQGDIAGTEGTYIYGNNIIANFEVDLGGSNQWSLLRVLPEDDITELRWIYRKGGSNDVGLDRGWTDSLRLYTAVTTSTQFCEALDLSSGQCNSVQSFSQQPPERQWIVDSSITPPPMGGTALRLPLRVMNDEKTCLSLPVAAGLTVMFSWRLNAASNSMLTFEVNNTVQLTLTGNGSDSGWTTATWTTGQGSLSISWCYQGAEITQAWVDALRILVNRQQFCSALRLSAADCALVESVETSPADPWEAVTGAETLSGRGYQSAPSLTNSEESVLSVTLAAGVAGLEFYRRVSSERRWDWFIFEYDDAERGSVPVLGQGLTSRLPYRSLPFFDGAGTRVQGDLSGTKNNYYYGNTQLANSDINLGANGEWSLLRLLPTDGDITELRWIYRKDGSVSNGQDRGWIDSLRLHQGLTNNTQLCEALDLQTEPCNTVRSFVQQPSTRQWTVDDGITPAPMGGSALRVPLRVADGEKACLSLSRPVTAGSTVAFSWRLSAAANSTLTFEVNDTAELTLAGAGSDSPWTAASWTTTEAVDSFAWCYQGAEVTQAWVDALSFTEPTLEINLTAVTTQPALTATSANGQQLTYSLQVQVAAPFYTLTAGAYDIGLRVTGTDAARVTTLQVTSQAAAPEGDGGLILTATLELELQQLQDTVELSLGLSGAEVGPQLLPLTLDVSEQTLALICIALDMEQADCALLSGYSTTAAAPWQAITSSFQSGDNLLASGTGLADDSQSCLTLNFASGSELPVGGRIDFLWAVDAAAGDGLQLRVSGVEIASFGGIGAGITPHRQQRVATAAVSSLGWCYSKDASGAGGADRGWVDDLGLLQPTDVMLLPADTADVCAVLDMTAADCSVLGALNQSLDTLNWNTDSAVHRSGGSSLRTPQTVADGETACLTLTLEPPLPAGTEVAFWWRVDSAAQSALELRFNGAALTPPVTINGLADSFTSNNGWRMQTRVAAAELTSLGWCYSRVAGMFAGTERGWVEQLRLNPPFVSPVFSRQSTVLPRANNGIEFTLRMQPGAGQSALPAGTMVLVRPYNLENVVLTTLTASTTAIDYRVTATISDTNDIARLRFTVGPLPPAVEPLPESTVFAVTIDSQAVVGAAMVLGALGAAPDAEPQGISLNDLLVALRLVAGAEVETLFANLGLNNGDRMEEMERFTALITDPDQSGTVDVNGDDAVDTLDFRLMVRYLSGLRGEELLCSSLCEARLRSLFSP